MADESDSNGSDDDEEYMLKFVKNASRSGSRKSDSARAASSRPTEPIDATELNTRNVARQSRIDKQNRRGMTNPSKQLY